MTEVTPSSGGPRPRRSSHPAKFVVAGQRFGASTVIDPLVHLYRNERHKYVRYARLRCDCGTEFLRLITELLKGRHTTCGHRCWIGRVTLDRAGQRFGKLTVVGLAPGQPHRKASEAWWVCRCDCGTELARRWGSLATGGTRSCGCIRKTGKPRKGYLPGEAAFNRVFRTYRRNAENRGLTWGLTKADVRRLGEQGCFYCGSPPATVAQAPTGNWAYNGIDRVDNSQGYSRDNVVTCCTICNHAKKDRSFDDFMAWIARLTEYHWFHPDLTPSRLLASVRTAPQDQAAD